MSRSFVHTELERIEAQKRYEISLASFIDIARLKYSKEKNGNVVNVEDTEVINYAVEYLHNDFYYY